MKYLQILWIVKCQNHAATFLGRENELEKITCNTGRKQQSILYGIAGIGKSELAKALCQTYKKEYTNILYLMYSGNLRQDIIDLDFADDLPEDTEENFRTRSPADQHDPHRVL